MRRPLDSTDRRILGELCRNARISHAELAERVHLSRNAIRQRIERLERDGVIRGYTVITQLGSDARPVSGMIFVYRHDRMRGADVIKAVRRIPEVVTCDILSGDFDLVVRVETSDADRIRSIWKEIAGIPGVRDTVTAFVLSSLVDRRASPWTADPPPCVPRVLD